MFRKSLEDFINSQRFKLAEERLKLSVISCEQKEYRRHDGDKRDEHIDHRKTPENDDDQNMLSIGEFSPNNPKMRVATQPFLGLGEYDHRRQMLNDQRKAEYQQYSEKVKKADEKHTAFMKSNFRESRPINGRSSSSSSSVHVDKASQTDIKNVHSKLVHYELSEKEEEQLNSTKDKQTKNISVPQSGYSNYMDRIGVVNSTSPRAKLMADLQSQCFPSAMGYIPPNTVDDDRFEKVRKQEKYMGELRKQVEEKKMLEKKHKEDELIEDDLESARVVTQQRNLNFNKREGFGHGRHCYSSDFPGSIDTDDDQSYDNKSDMTYNRYKRMNMNTNMNEKRLINTNTRYYSTSDTNTSKYSPLTLRKQRDIYKPPYSFNISPNSVFANSVPVPVNKKHSKLVLNMNNKITTKLNQKNNTNKFDESLPIPVLKAQSPVAKELINALPVHSKTSDAMRKLEDKWQIPAVQKNIIKPSSLDRPVDQGILTQLGAIRLQLQQEQLRLDETLRKRGTSQSQQTIYADIRRNIN